MSDTTTRQLTEAPQARSRSPQLSLPLGLAAAGVVMLFAGLGLDALQHSRDPNLAAHGSVFTLDSPAHLLFLAGLLLATGGLIAAAWMAVANPAARASAGPVTRSTRVLALGVAAMLVAGVAWAVVWTVTAGDDAAQTVDAAAGAPAAGGAARTGKKGAADPDNAAPVDQASPAEVAAATDLLASTIKGTTRLRDTSAATSAGYTVPKQVASGQARLGLAPNQAYLDDSLLLDPKHPEALIYAKGPGGQTLLVGVVYVTGKGQQGEAVGGPITRWVTDCADLGSGKACPGGQALAGRALMPVWFTEHLESAFAHRAPVGELQAWQQANVLD